MPNALCLTKDAAKADTIFSLNVNGPTMHYALSLESVPDMIKEFNPVVVIIGPEYTDEEAETAKGMTGDIKTLRIPPEVLANGGGMGVAEWLKAQKEAA